MIRISFSNGIPLTYGLVPGQSIRLELEDGHTWLLERGRPPRLAVDMYQADRGDYGKSRSSLPEKIENPTYEKVFGK